MLFCEKKTSCSPVCDLWINRATENTYSITKHVGQIDVLIFRQQFAFYILEMQVEFGRMIVDCAACMWSATRTWSKDCQYDEGKGFTLSEGGGGGLGARE